MQQSLECCMCFEIMEVAQSVWSSFGNTVWVLKSGIVKTICMSWIRLYNRCYSPDMIKQARSLSRTLGEKPSSHMSKFLSTFHGDIWQNPHMGSPEFTTMSPSQSTYFISLQSKFNIVKVFISALCKLHFFQHIPMTHKLAEREAKVYLNICQKLSKNGKFLL